MAVYKIIPSGLLIELTAPCVQENIEPILPKLNEYYDITKFYKKNK